MHTFISPTEQEIMDVIADSAENNTLLKRDTVFAQMNFGLKSGIFKIATQGPNLNGKKLVDFVRSTKNFSNPI